MFNVPNVLKKVGSVLGFKRGTKQPVMVVQGFTPPEPKAPKPLADRTVCTWALPVVHQPAPQHGLTSRVRRREAKALWHTPEQRQIRDDQRTLERHEAMLRRDLAGH